MTTALTPSRIPWTLSSAAKLSRSAPRTTTLRKGDLNIDEFGRILRVTDVYFSGEENSDRFEAVPTFYLDNDKQRQLDNRQGYAGPVGGFCAGDQPVTLLDLCMLRDRLDRLIRAEAKRLSGEENEGECT